ncbi:MAG: hypothetical protein ACP5IZ_10345, partial [Thermoprotei archaeon]
KQLLTPKTLKITLTATTATTITLTIILLTKFFLSGFFFLLNLIGIDLGLLTYLLTKENNKNIEHKKINNIWTLLTYTTLTSLTIISIFNSITYRVIYYYILITATFALITYQTLFQKLNQKTSLIILTQLILLNFLQRISLYLINGKSPWWDPYFHYMASLKTYENNAVPNLAAYTYFPLYFILNTEIWLIPLNNPTFEYIPLNAIVLSLSLIFPYIIIYKLFKNYKAALLSSITLSFTNIYNLTNYQTPHPFMLTLFILTLYTLLTTLIKKDLARTFITLTILLAFTAFLYHPSGGLFLAFSMLGLSSTIYVFRNKLKFFPILYLTLIITYILYLAGEYFDFFIRHMTLPTPGGLNPENPSNPGFTPIIQSISYYTLSHAWYAILAYLFAISLALLLFKKEEQKNYFLPILPISVSIYPLTIFSLGLSAEQTVGTGFIVLTMALTSGITAKILKNKAFTIIILALIITAFFSSSLLTDDNPYFNKYSYYAQSTLYTTQQAITTAGKFLTITNGLINLKSTDDIAMTQCCHISVQSYAHLNPQTQKITNNTYYFLNNYLMQRWANVIPSTIWQNYFTTTINNPQINIIISDGENFIMHAY